MSQGSQNTAWLVGHISGDLPRQDRGAAGGNPAWEGQEPGRMLHEMQERAQCQGMERFWGIKEELQGSKGAFCPRAELAGG